MNQIDQLHTIQTQRMSIRHARALHITVEEYNYYRYLYEHYNIYINLFTTMFKSYDLAKRRSTD